MRKGFSLLEVIFTLIIFAILFNGILGVFSFQNKYSESLIQKRAALDLASDALETYGIKTIPEQKDIYQLKTTLTDGKIPGEYLILTAQVSWISPFNKTESLNLSRTLYKGVNF